MVMKGMNQTARILLYGSAAAVVIVGGMRLSMPAWAGELTAELIVGTATGVPGGTASVVISLANDNESQGVSADLDIAYPDDLVAFNPPVAENCQVAERLSSTHQVGGTVPQPGLLRFAIFNPTGLEPLGNGEIATCDFAILPGVPVGTAALNVDFAELTGAEGTIPVVGIDGAIIIAEATLTPTPTSTPTGDGATPTFTATPTGTAAATTATATSTPTGDGATPTHTATATGGTVGTATSTHTVGTPGTPTATVSGVVTNTPTSTVSGTPATATATRTSTRRPAPAEDDGCNIVPAERTSASGTLALLLAPALLIWARRRRF
jgi:hypothetical protein